MFTKVKTLFNGKELIISTCEIFKFFNRSLVSQLITIPVEKTLVMHSPKLDCEILVDGEFYIE